LTPSSFLFNECRIDARSWDSAIIYDGPAARLVACQQEAIAVVGADQRAESRSLIFGRIERTYRRRDILARVKPHPVPLFDQRTTSPRETSSSNSAPMHFVDGSHRGRFLVGYRSPGRSTRFDRTIRARWISPCRHSARMQMESVMIQTRFNEPSTGCRRPPGPAYC
jgi:hypothetical protein